jgi:hypothetical protein
VIQSRLARLSEPARQLVGVAATIGREFTIDALGAASDLGDETLVGGLDELWRRRIIREQGADGYDFTHDKIRETAYAELSPVQRRSHHLRVARALERLHEDDPTPVSGQIAAHYELAGAAEPAIDWYERAASAARQMHADAETVRLLRRGIDLLRKLPETPERLRRELEFLTAMRGALVSLTGFRSAEATDAHDRAAAIAGRLGVELASPLLWSIAVANVARGNFDVARRHGERLRARGERDADDVVIVQGDYVLGISAFWAGEFDAAVSRFQSAIDRFRPEERRAHLLQYGFDPLGVCQMRLAFARWFMGYAADARRLRDEVIAQPFGQEYWWSELGVLHFAGLLSLELGDIDVIRRCLSRVVNLGESHDVSFVNHNVTALIGYIDVLEGRRQEGLQTIERVIGDLQSGNQMPGQHATVTRVLLAAHSVTGASPAGLKAASLQLATNDGARIWDAEARRVRAEFLAALGAGDDTVETELDLALQIARRQQARSLELRVAISLLRHRQARGDRDGAGNARALLATVFDAVADGTDTHDLREAACLLRA